ncbi:MAG: hypothetical protein AB1449_10495 [Chloroflexota bacterium]
MIPRQFRPLVLALIIVGALLSAGVALQPLIAFARDLSQAEAPEIGYRDLGKEITAIYEIENTTFLLTTHTLNNIEELIQYQRLQDSRLDSLDTEDLLSARVTFKLPLSLEETEEVLGTAAVSSLRYVSSPTGGGQLPYPVTAQHLAVLEAWEQDLRSQYGDGFKVLAGFTAAEIQASPNQLTSIADDRRTFIVDAGATDLLGQFANAISLSDNDVAYSYQTFVGSVCTIQDLIRLTDELATQGLIDDSGIHNSLQGKLHNANRLFDRGAVNPAANIIQAYINEVEAQRAIHIDEAAADKLAIVADCVAVRIADGP